MEIDHITYVVGSFSGKSKKEDNRKSLQLEMPLSLSLPLSDQQTRADPKAREDPFACPSCQRQFTEPRVLPCLHTFCTDCLLELVETQQLDSWSNSDTASVGVQSVLVGESSEGSGYGSAGSTTLRKTEEALLIGCPTCGEETPLPQDGVMALPRNYILQRRMLEASLHTHKPDLPCDLCSSHNFANSRCTQCQVNLCPLCAEAHCRQRLTTNHVVLSLSDPRMREGLSCGHAQLTCPAHPEQELRLFCIPCDTVTCRDCCLLLHRGHACETVERAAQGLAASVKDALLKAKPLAEQAVLSLDCLNHVCRRIQLRCSEVEQDIDRFIDAYIGALEDHRRALQQQVQEVRATRLEVLRAQQVEMQQQARKTSTAVGFTEDLLSHGCEVELLTFATQVQRQLELSCAAATGMMEPPASECLQFLPGERAGVINSCTLFGVITTQTVSPEHCTLNTEGLLYCRQNKKTEALLTVRDVEDQPLDHGGEKVVAELKYRDASNRRIPVHVTDLRNGSYVLSFVPETAGSLNLSVGVRGIPVKGSPFRVCVKTLRAHRGTFHCCTFCSSRGNKEATCGCKSTMPGYRGCGHGHEGHPGRRHWSCCGNLLQNSECGSENHLEYKRPSVFYPFTL